MPDLFSSDKITFRDKEACARRELEYRKRVYPRWIAAGKLKQAEADRQIEIMAAIVEDYAKAAELEMSGRDGPR
jgi:hypothetical protein